MGRPGNGRPRVAGGRREHGVINFVIFLVMFVTIIGPSAVIAAIGYASIRALGRNPSAAPKILQAMIVALVFAESIAVIALLILFQLFGRGG